MVEREITLEQMLFSGQDNALFNDHTWLAPKLFKVTDVRKHSFFFFYIVLNVVMLPLGRNYTVCIFDMC